MSFADMLIFNGGTLHPSFDRRRRSIVVCCYVFQPRFENPSMRRKREAPIREIESGLRTAAVRVKA
ncbi:hypothetical protein DLM86_22050 [Paenibacillus flagellatus]|uniref:Uncharacterized protein n=1 Tax=Paenibacillus flagellatus TaxID=2211139 RepID=A0A2V5K0R4_9BACL|nr:hypothetical protein DLM86_22050 [Paenibacillus flagellatus]